MSSAYTEKQPINSSLIESVFFGKDKVLYQNIYELKQGFEFGQMGMTLIGPKFKAFTTVSICLYLVGVISSKTIMSANILADTFEGVTLL